MIKWHIPIVLSCLASAAFAAEPFSISSAKYGGSSQSLKGTFSGEYSWAPPVLTVRIKEGTVSSERVNTKQRSPIEIRALICEESTQPPYFNRLVTSTEAPLKATLGEGQSIDVGSHKLTFQLPRKTKKDLQSFILGFQITWETEFGGYITMMAADTFLFGDKETRNAKEMRLIEEKVAGRTPAAPATMEAEKEP